MKYSAVIFDFNGTLFWDTPVHNLAWNTFLKKYNLKYSDDEFFKLIHGKNNKDILIAMFGTNITEAQIEDYIREKEGLYQNMCLEKQFFSLAPGAVGFFEFLRENKIPYTIATASGKENVDFYFKYLEIGKWFDYDCVVYNNGKIKSKPNGEIYEIAMAKLNTLPRETVIFEDAVAGLQAAVNANAGKVIVVNSNNDDYDEWSNYQIVTSFEEVDKAMFNVRK